MQLHPTMPVATQAAPADAPIQHGRCGSRARVAILLYLANRPVGARSAAIADAIGMDEPATKHLLTGLRRDGRVLPDMRFAHVLWYVPSARAEIEPARLQAMLEQALAGAQ